MMILFVKLTKGIGHKFYQLMKSSPIYTINSHSIMEYDYVVVVFCLVYHLCSVSRKNNTIFCISTNFVIFVLCRIYSCSLTVEPY